MSDLSEFAAHARRMAAAEHKPDCPGIPVPPGASRWRVGACLGCVTDADRALWARLALEAETYLNRHVEEGLFA